ncbi:quinol monooxygenase YgiN [Rhodococcus sp. 27YEA15]|uniref:putative quinol monooxygenase n=1 Tax=Rhodococcus sp. 27YEA15 TaxID=3156259 RepID=UPI003C7D178C
MSELRVVATIPAKSGSENEVRSALSALVEASRAEEGNVSYELFESEAAPGTFVTIETWRSQDDLNAHMQSAHLQAALAAAGPLLDGAPAIHPLKAS